MLQRFCDKYNVSCTILPEEYSFYRSPGTVMVVFAHKEQLENLISEYGLEKDKLCFLNPTINFYQYVTTTFIDKDTVVGDIARDMIDDKELPENKNNDKKVCDYIHWQSRGNSDVMSALKEALKKYDKFKNIGKMG